MEDDDHVVYNRTDLESVHEQLAGPAQLSNRLVAVIRSEVNIVFVVGGCSIFRTSKYTH